MDIMSIEKANNKYLMILYQSRDSFLGDKCQQGGNDFDIAHAVRQRENGVVYHVEDWEETWRILQTL